MNIVKSNPKKNSGISGSGNEHPPAPPQGGISSGTVSQRKSSGTGGSPVILSIIFLIMFIISLFLSPTKAFSAPTNPPTPSGGVKGVVRGMILQEGRIYYTRIPGAKVNLDFTKIETSTKPDGSFEIKNVPPGKYSLTAASTGAGELTREIEVRDDVTIDMGSLTLYLGNNAPRPQILPGSIVASFTTREKKFAVKRSDLPAPTRDTPTDRIIFYRPDTYIPYLELATDESPTWLAIDSKGEKLAIAIPFELVLWNLKELRPTTRFRIPGLFTDVRTTPDGKLLCVSFIRKGISELLIIDLAEEKIINRIDVPFSTGVFTATLLSNDGKYVYAAISGPKGGQIARINTATSTIETSVNLEGIPMDLLIPEGGNKILASCPAMESIPIIDQGSFKIKSNVTTGEKPGRMAQGINGKKAYITAIDKDALAILDTISGKITGTIPVGSKPFCIKRQDQKLFVCNRGDHNISIIDLLQNKAIATTPAEEDMNIQWVDVLPIK
jgi:hypothetical protein